MSKKQLGRGKSITGPRYRFFKVLCASTIVVACSAVCFGGINSGASMVTIVYTCLAITAVVGITFGLVIKAVASYEETRGG